MKTLIALLLLIGTNCVAQSKHDRIKERLKQIETVIGSWEVEAQYTPRSGEVQKEKGQYDISWALDSTYFHWHGTFTNVATGNTRYFLSLITYDQSENAYIQTYFLGKTTEQLTELGKYDADRRIFTTHLLLTSSDGSIEYLRNDLDLSDPDRLEYLGWAMFDGAEAVNNFTAYMVRRPE